MFSPAWLAGWEHCPQTLQTNDFNSNGRNLYGKHFAPGRVTLGPNRDSSMPQGISMYSVVITLETAAAREWNRYQ